MEEHCCNQDLSNKRRKNEYKQKTPELSFASMIKQSLQLNNNQTMILNSQLYKNPATKIN